jgi:hypothetical protein
MITIFSFEHLKNHPNYESLKEFEIVKFLRHLRNAAAHSNRFCFIDSKSKKLIEPGNISWRSKCINKSLSDSICFPDFFPYGDLAYLLEDLTKLLKQFTT